MGHRFRVGAKTYDIPEDKLDAFTDDMDARGVKYEPIELEEQEYPDLAEPHEQPAAAAAPAVASVTVERREPKVITLDVQPIEGVVPEDDIRDRFIKSPLGGALQGLAHGVSAGAGRLVPGQLGDNYRLDDDMGRENSPRAYMVGDLLGSIANPVNKLAPGGGGLISRIAGEGAVAGLEGGARALADSGGDVDEALAAGRGDATVASLITGASGPAGRAIAKLAELARESGLANRVAAAGYYGSGLKRLVQNKGEEYVQKLGQAIEDAGLHRAAPNSRLGGFDPRNWIPQKAGTYADNAADLKAAAERRMSTAEDAIAELPQTPTVNMNPIIARQRAGAARADGMADRAAAGPEAAFRRGQASGLEGVSVHETRDVPGEGWNGHEFMTPPSVEQVPTGIADWNNALAQRRYYDQNINWSRLGGYEGAPMQESVRREIANDLRGGVSNSLDEAAAAGTVPMEVRDAWQGGRADYQTAADVQKPAMDRKWQEQGNQALSLPSWSAAAGGMAAGGPLGAAASAIAAEQLKSRGRSAMAGAYGAASSALNAPAQGLQWVGGQAPVGAAVAALSNRYTGQQQGNQPVSTGTSQTQAGRVADGARGYRNGKVLSDLIDSGDTRAQLLSPWASELAGADTPDAMAAAIERLRRTDPEFARIVDPMLFGNGR